MQLNENRYLSLSGFYCWGKSVLSVAMSLPYKCLSVLSSQSVIVDELLYYEILLEVPPC